MNAKKKHYSNNEMPTRETSMTLTETITPAERMEADLMAGKILCVIKGGPKIQFTLDDAREAVFITAAFVHLHEYLTAHGVECRGMHLEDMVRKWHRMNPPK